MKLNFQSVAAVAALTLASVAAQAAEITFFERSDFRGRTLTLRGHTPDLSAVGFNDRLSSLAVRSGTWQLCTEPDFAGVCVNVGPGEYRRADERLNNRISSAREIGTYASEQGAYSRYGRGSIELFEERNFSGRLVALDSDTANFDRVNFNDRATSMVVIDGTWELCADAGYRGNCRTYGPGRYETLGYGMAKQVSSARLVNSYNDAPASIGNGYGDTNLSVGRAVLYDDDGLRGRTMGVSDNIINLEQSGFNDRTASIVVESGYFEMCTDAYFRGTCRVFGPGQYRNLDGGFHRSISSIRLAPTTQAVIPGIAAGRPFAEGNRRRNSTEPDIVFFEYDEFVGNQFSSKTDVPNLADRKFNDRARSMVIVSGQWQLCTDAEYSGRCVVYGPGRYNNLGGLSNQFSSLRRVY